MKSTLEEHAALASFISLCSSNKQLRLVADTFDSWEHAWNTPQKDYPQELQNQLGDILSKRENQVLESNSKILKKHGITVVSESNTNFPTLLKEISGTPHTLFVRGDTSCLNSRFPIAVVGSRKISSYGKAVLHEIIPPLVRAGATIVSGLAYGVDSLAHEIALDHGGHCIAVFGSGVDQIYPAEHHALANRILMSGGSLISEQALGTAPLRRNFPARNRIISGFSKSTLVIEARIKSGSLITADFALQQNRDVYAVPGDIFETNQKGTNMLISQGAYPIVSSLDLLERLNLLDSSTGQKIQRKLIFDSQQEEDLYHLLSTIQSMDDLSEQSSLDIQVLNQLLSLMELKGLIKNLGGMRYIRM
ncbi:MAG: DNA-processing protein DprA [Candidatus Gracilibacteria bacterium]|nr:DNA-processing protein DprA [Candidatus Gracilibacteria bacterium]